jgi:hypothetical protein
MFMEDSMFLDHNLEDKRLNEEKKRFSGNLSGPC